MHVIGVDISKDSFNYCIIDETFNKKDEGKFNIVRDDLEKFVNIVSNFKEAVVIVESTGIYHVNFVSFLKEKGINIKIVNPKVVKRYIDFYFANNPSKTDKKDAFAISIFGIKNKDIIDKLHSNIPSSIKMIAREIEYLTHQKASIKTKIKAHLSISLN